MAELVDPSGVDGGDAVVAPSPASRVNDRVVAVLTRSSGSSVEEIARATNLSSTEVQRAIGTLALEGTVVQSATGWTRA